MIIFLLPVLFFSPFWGKWSQTTSLIRSNARYQLFQNTSDYSRKEETKNGIFILIDVEFIPVFLPMKVAKVTCQKEIARIT